MATREQRSEDLTTSGEDADETTDQIAAFFLPRLSTFTRGLSLPNHILIPKIPSPFPCNYGTGTISTESRVTRPIWVNSKIARSWRGNVEKLWCLECRFESKLLCSAVKVSFLTLYSLLTLIGNRTDILLSCEIAEFSHAYSHLWLSYLSGSSIVS